MNLWEDTISCPVCNSSDMIFAVGPKKSSILIIGEAPGCVSGDTLIDVAYRDKSIYPKGIPIQSLVGQSGFYVYSYDIDNDALCVDRVFKVWKTGFKDTYKVTYEWKYVKGKDVIVLQDSIEVTSNHKFLLKKYKVHDPFQAKQREETYLSIQDGLSVGDSLQPILRHIYKYSYIGTAGQHTIKEARFLLENKVQRKLTKTEQCHHKNENKLDDTWKNLSLQTASNHTKLHLETRINPMYDDKIREKHLHIMQSKEYKDAASERMKNILSDPVKHAERLQQIQDTNPQRVETVKNLYKNAGYYYKYLLGRQTLLGLSDTWVYEKFTSRFPNDAFPVDNHKIVSIEYIGKRYVYDIETTKHHNFAANGIFVHNSDEVQSGKPYTGRTGTVLRTELGRLGIDMNRMRITNMWLHPKTDNEKCFEYGFTKALEEAKDKKAILLIGAGTLKKFCGHGVEDYNGLLVKSKWLSAPYIMACVQPAVVWNENGTLGEVRFVMKKFAELIEKEGLL